MAVSSFSLNSHPKGKPVLKHPFYWMIIGLALSLATTSALYQTTFAHSFLSGSNPPVGTSIEESPESFELFFTEEIDADFSGFTLFFATGEKLNELPFALGDEGKAVLLRFDTPLASGHYRIHWKVLSTVDGHSTAGIIPFSVGVVALPSEALALQSLSDPSPWRMVARWLMFTAMLLLAGSVLMPLIIPTQLSFTTRRETLFLLGAVFVLLIAGLVDLLFQAKTLEASLIKVVLQSRWGALQLLKYVIALVIGILLMMGLKNHVNRWLAQTLAGALLLTNALAGHNANLGPLGVAADWAHLAAAALWLGGLTQLAWIWIPGSRKRPAENQILLMKTLIPQFSQLALISVSLLSFSGVYFALQYVPSWRALFHSLYGQALLAKIALLLPIMALALVNRCVQLPKMERWIKAASAAHKSMQPVLAGFRRLVIAEVIILIALLFFAGMLTTVSPPHSQIGHAQQSAQSRSAAMVKQAETFTIRLEIQPAVENGRVIEVAVHDAAGNPVASILRVRLDFQYLDENLGDTFFSVVADTTPEGRYRISGPYLTLPGNWQIRVIIRMRGRAADVRVDFPVKLTPKGKISSLTNVEN